MPPMIWIWLLVVVVAAILEVTGTALFMATVAVAALITALSALAIASLPVQLGIFAGLCLVGILFIRPAVVQTLGIGALGHHTDPLTGHIVGHPAIVTRPVNNMTGQIRFGESEFWSARTQTPDEEIEPGAVVEVIWVEGLHAVVARAPESGADDLLIPPTQSLTHDDKGVIA